MPGAATIRKAVAADLDGVSRLLGETWHATYDGIYGHDKVSDITGRWHSVQNLQRSLAQEHGAFLVAERDGELEGTASAVTNTNGTQVDLLRLYVRPASQGRGLGRALLSATFARFPAAEQITLEVVPANAKAIAFYQSQGFVIAGTVADCGGSGDRIPALKMVRALPA